MSCEATTASLTYGTDGGISHCVNRYLDFLNDKWYAPLKCDVWSVVDGSVSCV